MDKKHANLHELVISSTRAKITEKTWLRHFSMIIFSKRLKWGYLLMNIFSSIYKKGIDEIVIGGGFYFPHRMMKNEKVGLGLLYDKMKVRLAIEEWLNNS